MTTLNRTEYRPGDVVTSIKWGTRYKVVSVQGRTVTIESPQGYERPVPVDHLRLFYR